jgi:predicted phage-related endonuclease
MSSGITAYPNRRAFIGGSNARIIMGDEEAALLRLWREKRGEIEPERSRRPARSPLTRLRALDSFG